MNASKTELLEIHADTALFREALDAADVRQAAVFALRGLVTPDAKEVLQRVVDSREGTRYFAAPVLGEIGDPTAIPTLANAWRTHPPDRYNFRQHFLNGIVKIGGAPAVSAFRELFAKENEEGRADLLWELPDIQSSLTVPLLLVGLGDESGRVRSLAWAGLQQLGQTDLVAGLAAALTDPLPAARRYAAQIAPFYADLNLEARLRELNEADPDTVVKERARDALNAVAFKRQVLSAASQET